MANQSVSASLKSGETRSSCRALTLGGVAEACIPPRLFWVYLRHPGGSRSRHNVKRHASSEPPRRSSLWSSPIATDRNRSISFSTTLSCSADRFGDGIFPGNDLRSWLFG